MIPATPRIAEVLAQLAGRVREFGATLPMAEVLEGRGPWESQVHRNMEGRAGSPGCSVRPHQQRNPGKSRCSLRGESLSAADRCSLQPTMSAWIKHPTRRAPEYSPGRSIRGESSVRLRQPDA